MAGLEAEFYCATLGSANRRKLFLRCFGDDARIDFESFAVGEGYVRSVNAMVKHSRHNVSIGRQDESTSIFKIEVRVVGLALY